MLFVDRERELAALESAYASDRAELYVLYGRRRVGKTELLRRFCEGKRSVFYIADLGTQASALADFTRQVSLAIFTRPDAIGAFPTWDAALEFMAQQATHERLTVVIDEFTYLGQADPAIASILQRVWDRILQHTRIMLILCGSYVGMMEQQVLGYRAPLYGRRTGQWQLQPMEYISIKDFFPSYQPADRVRTYAVLGGIPAYLRQFDPLRPLAQNIERQILTIGAYLYDEPRLLLLQELPDPGRYFAILEALANKRTRPNETAQAAGIPASSMSFYLGTLRSLGLVDRLVRVTEPHPERSKQGSYRITDGFFRFWFRYVYPNRSLLGRGETSYVQQQVEQTLDEFASQVFEDICREHVWLLGRTNQLGFAPKAVGNWATRDSSDEIDVVAIGENEALLGECKWSSRPVSTDVFDSLIQKTVAFRRDQATRDLPAPNVRYAVFSRSGFTPEAVSRAEAESILAIDLADLG